MDIVLGQCDLYFLMQYLYQCICGKRVASLSVNLGKLWDLE